MMDQQSKAELAANEYARQRIENGIDYFVSGSERDAFLAGAQWAVDGLGETIARVVFEALRKAASDD